MAPLIVYGPAAFTLEEAQAPFSNIKRLQLGGMGATILTVMNPIEHAYVLLIRSGMSKPVDLGCFAHYWGNLTLSGRDQDPERILMPFWYLQNLSRKQDDPHAANV
ncbi:hypothetical protein [Paenibacillus sp. SSG-1]|uniref:hypothetical protein n=1 Tax=Paenibacillus sp. SSG-1 TaxID=1443669 RepID=UPI001C52F5F4|nr:hypothetical protein [Paenibacillus sp. SSG-1]